MLQRGFPDFGNKIQDGSVLAFASYQGQGNAIVLPNGLEIAYRRDKTLDFKLEAVRSALPFGSPRPHGVISFRLLATKPELSTLERVRQDWTMTGIGLPVFSSGFVRFHTVGDNIEDNVAEELFYPLPLDWNGLPRTQLVRILSMPTLSILKAALEDDLLAIQAVAELTIVGIAPRIPVQIVFNPAEVLLAMTRIADENKWLAVTAIVELFRKEQQNPSLLNFHTESNRENDEFFAQVMTDWVIQRFCEYTAAPIDSIEPTVVLPASESFQQGRFSWDLSQPNRVRRMFILSLNPFAAARELVQSQGIESIYKETVVSPLSNGVLKLFVTPNLDFNSESTMILGVRIHVPPNLSHRPQAINETIVFEPGEDQYELLLRFSIAEEPSYNYTTFIILHDTDGTRELEGEAIMASDNHLRLSLSDFPVDIIPMRASSSLLDQAIIRGLCRWFENELPRSIEFELSQVTPEETLILPKGMAENALIEIEPRALVGADRSELTTVAAVPTHLSLFSFKEYGPHHVEIECLFDQNNSFHAIELIPEGNKENPDTATILSFTPSRPIRSWKWFAKSIFQSGFYWRRHSSEGEATEQWSDLQSPFIERITINMRTDIGGIPNVKGDLIFQDIHYFPNPMEPGWFYYIPNKPGPQLTQQEDPTLLLLIDGDTGLLQLNSRWQASSKIIEQLRETIAKDRVDTEPALIKLSFAPVVVEKVSLELQREKAYETLGVSTSSGSTPYSAIFNQRLNQEQLDQVINALSRRTGVLLVRYFAQRIVKAQVTVQIQGDLSIAGNILGAESTLAECRTLIDREISENKLTRSILSSEYATEKLHQQTSELALDEASKYLHNLLVRGQLSSENSLLAVDLTLQESVSIPFTLTTDVGTWFVNGNGHDHIRIINTGSDGDNEGVKTAGTEGAEITDTAVSNITIRVRLAFDPEQTPLAQIRIKQGLEIATLSAPDFNEIELLNANPTQSIEIETSYSDGGSDYQSTQVLESSELLLQPEMLGLALIMIDGKSRQSADIKRLRVHLKYCPDKEGESDSNTFYLENNQWQAKWFVITRSSQFNGTLEVETKETKRIGRSETKRFETSETVLVFK